MQLDPAVSPVAAALVLVLPRTVGVEPHEWDEAFRGRPVGAPYLVVGHPKVGALLWVVERKDHRAVDPIVVEIPQQADEVELTAIAIPTHMRVRVPDRRHVQHIGGQATQVGVRMQRHARLWHGRDLEVALVRDPVCRHHLIVAAPTRRRSVRSASRMCGRAAIEPRTQVGRNRSQRSSQARASNVNSTSRSSKLAERPPPGVPRVCQDAQQRAVSGGRGDTSGTHHLDI